MARRQHLSLMIILGVVAFFSISYLFSGSSRDAASPAPPAAAAPLKGDSVSSSSNDTPDLGHISNSILAGESIAPKLENATAKAELGRASWKLFHTMMARFPEKPTPDDSLALKTYIQLFARLYPCGDCAAHFRKLLAKYPPQTSSRNAAAGWACFVHNEVNTRLKKEQFDCNKIGDFYDCGCGDEDKKKAEAGEKPSLELERDGVTHKMDFTTTGMLNEDGIHVDMDRLKKGEVNLGTSIMAVTFKDGVILGADSRTTTGAYIANRVTDKLTQVHDTIWCCRSGSAADTQAVADIVQYQLGLYAMRNGKPPTTQTAAAIFQEICYSNKDRLSAGLIIAGWDERHGGQVYSIPLGGSLHKQSYAIGGSGSTYIYGYCDANWKEGMEEKDAVDFVKGALREAIKWDGSSGGVIRMVVLTAKGAHRHLYLPDEDYTVKH
ncbi:proteasome A-type and B-type [Colletotrichum karsti]|uniref:Sulfhydryl oxidase n=1 Tax=Colletotrichum karsti TaxID=1095194 RepID=A0A9P6LFI8_9PEZI|nr:proteasome A-type and B-type [Colletotrichum karsti]KAF9870615.1 proteasome A-type and B-type [Colletotrichum karsti]